MRSYWLPSLLKHEHTALRFLPQAGYERAASLDITPKPDIVTRVLMLFQGVTETDARQLLWDDGEERGEEAHGVARWREYRWG